jgi:hypothetical protein
MLTLLTPFRAFKGTLSQKDAGWPGSNKEASDMSSEAKHLERGRRAMVPISVYNHAFMRLRTLRTILQKF